MDLATYIRDIPDFPKPGIVFKDIAPLLADGPAFARAVDRMAGSFSGSTATKIVAPEARGFIFGAALAYKLGIGLVPVRKPGKLPYKTHQVTYELEYGTDTLCMHQDAVAPGERVLIVDDLLATGGTIDGILKLLAPLEVGVAGIGFLVELDFLKGRERLGDHRIVSLLHVDGE
jgi:adenine phosphoribosyltransferase